ncbi:MAG: hypothetical protein J2P13_03515 [Acidobacteria bacterium]|nr:hypothetical protein [Acidobacteriota bacterium]
MFRIGKRRPEEEDSIVPHGMIWYATPEKPSEGDTPETPPEPGDESIEPTVHYAQVMEIMRRAARTPADKPCQENSSELEPAAAGITRPAPVPWWRIPQPDPEPEASALSFPPAAVTPPGAAVTPSPNPAFPLKIEGLTAPPAAPPPANSASITEIRSEAREVEEIEEVKEVEIEVNDKDRQKEKDKDESKGDVKQDEPSEAEEGRIWPVAAVVSNFARSSLARSRHLAAEGRRLFSRAAAKAVSERPARGWKPPRVRIVLTGLPLRIKILLARRLSEWKMQSPSATTDTGGLRTAVIIAAACAVVALICILLAPHFAAGFLPSRSLPPSSMAGRKTAASPHPAAAPPSQSAPGSGSQPPETGKPSSSAPARKAREEKPSPGNGEAQRKHRRAGDDDYVAPDTYKYYGK